MSISIIGAGAFGTSLAIALARDGTEITLWGRDEAATTAMQRDRGGGPYLPNVSLPDNVHVTSKIADANCTICLISIPTQSLSKAMESLRFGATYHVACCKGIDRKTGLGPVKTLQKLRPGASAAILTGPSFAVDIAAGLPTALVLASADEGTSALLQAELTRPALRLYRSTDVVGAELGGALKNVVALAAGMAIGAGLGDSARASVIARGFAEMTRYAMLKGGTVETLHGLSGLGDMVLTCTSEKSRNFAAGIALGKGEAPKAITVEGLATSQAVAADADNAGLDLPLMKSVAQVASGKLDISSAIATLLARPVGKE